MAARPEHFGWAAETRLSPGSWVQRDSTDPVAMRWAVTATFYAAVHYVEAHLADFGVHSTGHENRAFNIHGAPDEAWSAYRTLYDKSRTARYYGGTFTAQYVQDVLLDNRLVVIKALL